MLTESRSSGPLGVRVVIRQAGKAPPARGAPNPSGANEPGAAGLAAPKAQGRSRSILVVDDSPIHLRLVARQLQAYLGCDVVEASGTEEAIIKLLAGRPDLIVTDLMMPDLDGVDLVTIAQTRGAWAPIPVVILSAVSDFTRVRALSGVSVREYLLKPFDPAVAIPRIRGILQETADTASDPDPDVLAAPDDRIPVLVASAEDAIVDVVRREIPALYHVLTVSAGPGALPAAIDSQPFAVLLARDSTPWDVHKTLTSLRALRTLEHMRSWPLPAGEQDIAELVRREFAQAPFSIEATPNGISVLLEKCFTVSCVKALARNLDHALAECAAEVVFGLPAQGLGPKALAAIQQLTQSLSKRC